ncbi:MAG: glycosyltransferase [Clostridia bacterium]|nr:glycosyltransferase [Clostridia bacterium]
MTLTVICDVLGKENNGTTIAAMNLIRSMREKGHTVRVVCPDECRRGEKDYYVVPTLGLGPLNGYLAKNGVLLAKPDKNVLHEALDGADAVHIITPFLLSMSAVKMVNRLKLPVTAGFHCQAENFTNHIFLMNRRGVNRLVYKVFDSKLYRHVDCIHYPTQFICNVFESEIGHKTEHRVISNGVNSIFTPEKSEKPEEFKERFVILFTGRYSKEKSHSVLIEAANRSKYRESIQLIFAGCGPQEKHLRKLAAKLPNEPVFSFFSRQELLKVINYSDLYVHPAEIEIEAIACLEAISCGLVPVISDSPRSATRFFAQDERNLFKCNDADDLANKIDWWIEHPKERLAAGKRYCGYSKQFDFNHCMDEMERMIVDNVEAARGTR